MYYSEDFEPRLATEHAVSAEFLGDIKEKVMLHASYIKCEGAQGRGFTTLFIMAAKLGT